MDRLLMVLSLLAGAAAHAADSAVVLMYHRFGEDSYPSTNVRMDQFEAQLEFLAENDFIVIPLEALVKGMAKNTELPDKAVVITIDDAYVSVIERAHPLLRRYGFPYTVFVASDGVDAGIADYMSWAQMRRLRADGVSFANHGASHGSLIDRSLSDGDHLAWVQSEIETAMERLGEEGLEPLAGVFAYPYGEFNDEVMSVLQKLGYDVGFGQHSGPVGPMSRPLAMPRYPINENYAAIDEFRTRTMSRPLPVEAVEPGDYEIQTRLPLIEIELAAAIDGPDFSGLACYVGGQGRVAVDWLEPNERFNVGPERPLSPGRNRVNCTAPAGGGRYYWYSHPWFVVDP